jgi:carbon-monoxide dehydrogenase large subunit
VTAVWVGAELNGDVPVLWDWGGGGVRFPAVHPLADGDVRFAGDPVAVVVAESRYVAEDACELVDVAYEPLAPVVGREAALTSSEVVHPELDGNVAWTLGPDGAEGLEEVLGRCAHVVTETVHQHRHLNVPMEPRGVVASWEPGAGELTVHVSSQNPHQDRAYLARLLGLDEHRVRVVMRDVGGAFGQKIFFGREPTAVVLASRRLGLPVKWIEDRQENLMAASSARDEQATVTIGLDAAGAVLAMRVDYLGDLGAYPQLPPGVLGGAVCANFAGPYRVGTVARSARTVYTNTCGLSAYRGPWLMETVARETVLDLAARRAGIDPAELRRRNTLQPDDLPHTTATGLELDRITPAGTLEAALEAADYDGFRARQARARADGRFLGIGISHFVEPTAGAPGPASIEVATVRVEPSGKVNLLMGTGSHGQSLETTMPQVVAERLGVPIDDVVLHQGDTAVAPFGGGTAGSRSAVIGGNAARLAADRVRAKALEIAAHLLEADVERLAIDEGVIALDGDPERSLPFARVAWVAHYEPRSLPAGMEPGLESTARFVAPPTTFGNATHVCACEVDVETGLVTILDYVVAEDCGVMINPMVVEGQIAGGVTQGIGGALLEHLPYDEDGNPLAITLKDYLMPTAETVPDFRYAHVETPSNTPGGHKGVAESGAIGAPAAVVNAVADALAPLGVGAVSQPLAPDRILALIDQAAAAAAVG